MKKLLSSIAVDKSDALLVVGIASLCRGLHLIYSPSAYVALGVLLIGLAVYPHVRREAK